MKQHILWLTIFSFGLALTTANAQALKAKPAPKEIAKSAAPEWPECCWVGKVTAATTPAPEPLVATQPTTEAISEAAVGASSGADFTTTSGGEETEEETSEETAAKGKDLKRKLAGAAIKLLADKLKNKNEESSASSESPETVASSDYIGETEKNVTSSAEGSVQEVQRPNNAVRRQRIQALREKMGSASTTTDTATANPLDSVQEIKRPGTTTRRGTQQRPMSGDTSNAAATDTPVNRVRPLRNPANTSAGTNATVQTTPAPAGNPNARILNRPKIAAIRAAQQNNQNDTPEPRRTPRPRPRS